MGRNALASGAETVVVVGRWPLGRDAPGTMAASISIVSEDDTEYILDLSNKASHGQRCAGEALAVASTAKHCDGLLYYEDSLLEASLPRGMRPTFPDNVGFDIRTFLLKQPNRRLSASGSLVPYTLPATVRTYPVVDAICVSL